MTGVAAYYDYKDIPGQNNVIPSRIGFLQVEELFCSGKVAYYYQPIGIVVANKQELALQAANKVKVYFTSPKTKPLITIQDVLNANAKERILEQTTVVASKTGK